MFPSETKFLSDGYFCEDSISSDKIDRILGKHLIVTIVPQEMPEAAVECAAWMRQLGDLLTGRYRMEAEILYHFDVAPGTPVSTGLTTDYFLRLYARDGVTAGS